MQSDESNGPELICGKCIPIETKKKQLQRPTLVIYEKMVNVGLNLKKKVVLLASERVLRNK